MDRHLYSLAPDPARSIEAFPAHLTPAQAQARAAFDLGEAMASLPPSASPVPSPAGAAGVRLREGFACSWPDDLLREFARDVLKAKRISAKYLEALRIMLGNQALAGRRGYVLEMNLRTGLAPERVMRNIIDQMKAAGLTEGVKIKLGGGKVQIVQCYTPPERPQFDEEEPDLETYLRAWEDRNGEGWPTMVGPDAMDCIRADEVPY